MNRCSLYAFVMIFLCCSCGAKLETIKLGQKQKAIPENFETYELCSLLDELNDLNSVKLRERNFELQRANAHVYGEATLPFNDALSFNRGNFNARVRIFTPAGVKHQDYLITLIYPPSMEAAAGAIEKNKRFRFYGQLRSIGRMSATVLVKTEENKLSMR